MSRKKQRNKNYQSNITHRIVIRYIAILFVYIFSFFLLVGSAYFLTHLVIWQAKDPLYRFLKQIKDHIVIIAAIPLIIGWITITAYFIRRSLGYLDEVIAASKKLAHLTEEQIILSDPLKSVQDELNQVRETALHNAQLAKEVEQRKNDLIVYLAHDLKTPLTSIIGYLTLLHDEEQISEKLREKYLSISLDKAERLEDLINEFFEITRFNLTNIELQFSKINLTRLLEQLTFEFKPMLQEKNLQCNLETKSDIMMKCDVNKIQRVFDNLLRNAVFYSFEDTTIQIIVEQRDTEVMIKFINQGNTISEEKLERIFEQFYRLDAARSTNNGGAGLGLAIAKEIITLHHGTIEASSEKERIEFCVTLPLS